MESWTSLDVTYEIKSISIDNEDSTPDPFYSHLKTILVPFIVLFVSQIFFLTKYTHLLIFLKISKRAKLLVVFRLMRMLGLVDEYITFFL